MTIFRPWQHRRFHSAYGLAWVCFGLLCGLGLSKIVMIRSWTILLCAIVVTIVCFIRLRWYMIGVMTMMAIIVGIIHGSFWREALNAVEGRQGNMTEIQGVVADDPVVTARGDTTISISHLVLDNASYRGSVWATLRGEHILSRGDTVTIKGQPKSGFGPYQLVFSYPDVVSSQPSGDKMVQLRDNFARAVRRDVVEPAASLGIGFVVGQKSALPHQLDEQLRIVGLTHLIVASGYNLTILVRAAKRLFEKRSKFLVLFATTIMTIGFMAISGASPSMTRAGLVAGLSIAVWYYGRTFHPIMLILYVAALTGMLNPQYLWSDIGWWLSFLAFIGVLIVSPMLINMIYRTNDKNPHGIVQIMSETISAQLMTLPLILLVFGKLPVLSVVANILTAPLVPLAMLFTTIAGVGSMIATWGGSVFGLPAEILLSYFIAIVRLLALPPWSQLDMAISAPVMIALYIVVAGIGVIAWRKTRYNFRSQSIIE